MKMVIVMVSLWKMFTAEVDSCVERDRDVYAETRKPWARSRVDREKKISWMNER